MTVPLREDRGPRAQIRIVGKALRQEPMGRAVKLLWPVLRRRVVEIFATAIRPAKIFSPRFWRIRAMMRRMLPDPDGAAPEPLGNYAAFPQRLNADAVIYSFGVGGDVRFDAALTKVTSATVHLFAPTPRAARFMKAHAENDRLKFHPWGVWTTDGVQKFFSESTLIETEGGDIIAEARSGSIMTLSGTSSFGAECLTLQTIMRRLGHRRIDLLKLDIEGAALDVLEDLLRGDPRPGQIIAELEVPRRGADLVPFFVRLETLFNRLRDDGYSLWPLRRGFFHTESIEVLAARS
ncbi:MAG: FkbM family methyltransferase [Parvibaculaceae bacterium]